VARENRARFRVKKAAGRWRSREYMRPRKRGSGRKVTGKGGSVECGETRCRNSARLEEEFPREAAVRLSKRGTDRWTRKKSIE